MVSEKSSVHRQQVGLQMDGYLRFAFLFSLMKWGGSFSTRQTTFHVLQNQGFLNVLNQLSITLTCPVGESSSGSESSMNDTCNVKVSTHRGDIQLSKNGSALTDKRNKIYPCAVLNTLWPFTFKQIYFRDVESDWIQVDTPLKIHLFRIIGPTFTKYFRCHIFE